MKKPLVFWICMMLVGCATQAPRPGAAPPPVLDFSGTDESGAAVLLGSYFLARGYTVEPLAPGSLRATSADGDVFFVEVQLEPAGLDRLLLSRVYPAREGVDPGVVERLAAELNAMLNVGVFSVYPPGVRLLSPLPFVDTLAPEVLEAFIAFTGDVAFAVERVEDGRQILVPLEAPETTR